jgi:hypothetical protein
VQSQGQGFMDNTISFEEVAALVVNPPSLAPHPNFTNSCTLRHHIQRTLQCLSCPQSNILGWAGLIMARPMYGLLPTTPFRIPSNPDPVAIYYPCNRRCTGSSGPGHSGTPNISRPAHHRTCCASYYRCTIQTRKELLHLVFEYMQGSI